MVELTCGNEENFEDQKARKLRRYEQLLVEIETAGWKGDLLQQPLCGLDYCSFCCMLVGVIPCHVFGHFRRGFCLYLLQL